jgi:uncharacterized membrane protein
LDRSSSASSLGCRSRRFAADSATTLFSIYLTALEPFVIGATCAWCLSSAVIVTLLLMLSANGVGLNRPSEAARRR